MSKKSKTEIKLALAYEATERPFAWITVGGNDIYYEMPSDAYPRRFTYHPSGHRHLKGDMPVPAISDPSEEATLHLDLSHGQNLAEFRGIELLFAGWVSKHPVVLDNLKPRTTKREKKAITVAVDMDRGSHSVIGFQACLLEPNRPDLIPLSLSIPWRSSMVNHKYYLLEQLKADVAPVCPEEGTLMREEIVKSCSPWIVIQLWDGLPFFLRHKFAEQQLKGLGIIVPERPAEKI